MTTPIDRESVEGRAKDLEGTLWYEAKMLRALRAALDAAEAENKRLQGVSDAQKLLNLYAVEVFSYGATSARLQNLETAWINLQTQSEIAALQENPDG